MDIRNLFLSVQKFAACSAPSTAASSNSQGNTSNIQPAKVQGDAFVKSLSAPVETEETTQDEEATTNEPETYSGSMTLIEGEETPYYREDGDYVYYYASRMDLNHSMILADPTSTAVGKAAVNKNWGEKTEYYLISNGSKWYFNSRQDLFRAKLMTDENMRNLAVGRHSMEHKGGEDVQNNADAVVELKGQKSEYYMDIEGTRYYYSSPRDMVGVFASLDPAAHSCGSAEVMTEWGKTTDYYIDYKGSRYYFASEEDKALAEEQLNKDSGIWGMMEFNKYLVGRGKIN